jgi:hypothetical protein
MISFPVSCTCLAGSWDWPIQSLTEEIEPHVVVRVFLLFIRLLLLNGSSGGRVTSTSSRCRASILVGVLDAILELFDAFPFVLGLDGNRKDLLVGIDHRMHDRWQGREVESERDGGNRGDGAGKGLEQLALLNVENGRLKCLAIIVDLRNSHTVGEGRDVEHVQQGGFGSTDLGAGRDELEIGGDFNGTTGNLGRDTKGLEEGCLAGLHASVSSRHPHIGGSNGSSTSGSCHPVAQNLVADRLQVSIGEDEADVASDEGEELVDIGEATVGNEALETTADPLSNILATVYRCRKPSQI